MCIVYDAGAVVGEVWTGCFIGVSAGVELEVVVGGGVGWSSEGCEDSVCAMKAEKCGVWNECVVVVVVGEVVSA